MKNTISKLVMITAALCFFTYTHCTIAFTELLYCLSCCSISPGFMAAAAPAPPYVIAIDPGHGGMDTGAQAIVEEYAVVEKTADYLAELLAADPDFIPFLTRTDTDPSSAQRAAAAASAGASLFISIHANSDSSPSSHGFECFPAPPGHIHHTESLRFAQLVTTAMSEAGHRLRGGEEKSGIKYAYYSGKRKIIVDSSDSKIRALPTFGVLEKSDCPALLVEQCFITNSADVENWASDTGCRRAAAVYYAAIRQFFAG